MQKSFELEISTSPRSFQDLVLGCAVALIQLVQAATLGVLLSVPVVVVAWLGELRGPDVARLFVPVFVAFVVMAVADARWRIRKVVVQGNSVRVLHSFGRAWDANVGDIESVVELTPWQGLACLLSFWDRFRVAHRVGPFSVRRIVRVTFADGRSAVISPRERSILNPIRRRLSDQPQSAGGDVDPGPVLS